MKKQNFVQQSLITLVIVTLAISLLPVRAARADGITTHSDLVVNLISMPKHAKACETFEVKFTVTNLGPDPATHIGVWMGIGDQFDTVNIINAPFYLDVGDTATVTAFVKVTAFVPGESRDGWVSANAQSDPYPDISIDPNSDNNYVGKIVKLISKPVMSCW